MIERKLLEEKILELMQLLTDEELEQLLLYMESVRDGRKEEFLQRFNSK